MRCRCDQLNSALGPAGRRLAAVCLAFVALFGEARADTFLCAGQLSTGFAFDGESWRIRPFEVVDKVFVVQPAADLADSYTVTRIGDQQPTHYCPTVRPSDGSLLLTCGGLGSGFAFSSRTLRFQENYGIGYIGGADEGANRPYLLIGKCTRLDLRGVITE
ncbi:MAG: hypothetical protein ABWZ57_19505 [Mesorhizobium sp.]|jgi:hypothetical protein